MLPAILASPLLDWLALVSLFGFAAMGVDKMLAVGEFRRVSERTLWLTALVGGFVGIIAGAVVFHPKTSKPEFWAPVVVAVVIWVIVLDLLKGPQLL